MRLERSSSFTVRLRYPLSRSAPMVMGRSLVTSGLLRPGRSTEGAVRMRAARRHGRDGALLRWLHPWTEGTTLFSRSSDIGEAIHDLHRRSGCDRDDRP